MHAERGQFRRGFRHGLLGRRIQPLPREKFTARVRASGWARRWHAAR